MADVPADAPPVRPDDPGLADAAAGLVGAYLHIPFCRRVCPYCDFAVVAGAEDRMGRYVDALVAEIGGLEPFARPLDAVFVGGGTPTRLPADLHGRVLGALRERFGVSTDVEVSLEANPEDWSPELAEGLVRAGFTRVSFGAQSFDPSVLAALGRMHAPADSTRAITEARTAGFASISVDLIFGTPGETLDSWCASVERALDPGIDHLSMYALTVELGTPLSRAVRAGAPAPDPDLQADMWEAADELAATAGFVRYETSNVARPGHPCRYNLLTWAQGEYAAAGLGAHGHREGVRTRNVRRLDRYLETVEAGRSPVQGSERIVG
ncbi:MAG TPA: radical SAM family heme chaperone HemW, partial [Acidimicrobiia bacterium]|nr:radical SAM family heme chaperone HemW [Acidimicrobiia bacterium]